MPKIVHYETTFKSMLSHIEKTIKAFYTEEELHTIPIQTLVEQQIAFVKSLASTESNLEDLAYENEKLNATHLLHWNHVLDGLTQGLLENEKFDQIHETIFSSMILGVYLGLTFRYKDEDDHFAFLDKLAFKDLGRTHRKAGHDARNEILRKDLEPYLEKARLKWSQGDNAYHEEMAKYILDQNPNIASLLTKNQSPIKTIKKHLKPIALEFGRVRGQKKH